VVTDTAPSMAGVTLGLTHALLALGTLAVWEMPVRLCTHLHYACRQVLATLHETQELLDGSPVSKDLACRHRLGRGCWGPPMSSG
jgi:hypothetical protein